MEKKEFESEPLGSHKALEVGRVVPVSALLSDAGAQKMRSAFVAASQYL